MTFYQILNFQHPFLEEIKFVYGPENKDLSGQMELPLLPAYQFSSKVKTWDALLQLFDVIEWNFVLARRSIFEHSSAFLANFEPKVHLTDFYLQNFSLNFSLEWVIENFDAVHERLPQFFQSKFFMGESQKHFRWKAFFHFPCKIKFHGNYNRIRIKINIKTPTQIWDMKTLSKNMQSRNGAAWQAALTRCEHRSEFAWMPNIQQRSFHI